LQHEGSNSSPRRTDCRVQEKVSMRVNVLPPLLALVCLQRERRIKRPCLKNRFELGVVNDGFDPKFILRNSNPNGWVNGDSRPSSAIGNATLTHSLDVVFIFVVGPGSSTRRRISVSNQVLSVCAQGSSLLSGLNWSPVKSASPKYRNTNRRGKEGSLAADEQAISSTARILFSRAKTTISDLTRSFSVPS
jgi:hypothetical protein